MQAMEAIRGYDARDADFGISEVLRVMPAAVFATAPVELLA